MQPMLSTAGRIHLAAEVVAAEVPVVDALHRCACTAVPGPLRARAADLTGATAVTTPEVALAPAALLRLMHLDLEPPCLCLCRCLCLCVDERVVRKRLDPALAGDRVNDEAAKCK